MAPEEEIRAIIKEIYKLRKEIRNLEAKIKRRFKKIQMTYDPLERQRLEFEIELFKRKIRRWEIVESVFAIPFVSVMGKMGNSISEKPDYNVDWSKAAKA